MWVSDKVDEESEEDSSNDEESKDDIRNRLHNKSPSASAQTTAKDLYQRKDAVKPSGGGGMLPLSQRLGAAVSPRTTAATIGDDIEKKLCLSQGAVQNSIFKDSPVKNSLVKDSLVKNSVFHREGAVKNSIFKDNTAKNNVPHTCDRPPNAVKINVADDKDRLVVQSTGKVNFARDKAAAALSSQPRSPLLKAGADKDRCHQQSGGGAVNDSDRRLSSQQQHHTNLTTIRSRGPSPIDKCSGGGCSGSVVVIDKDRQRLPNSNASPARDNDKKVGTANESWRRNLATSTHRDDARAKTGPVTGGKTKPELGGRGPIKSSVTVGDKVTCQTADKGAEKSSSGGGGGEKVKFLQPMEEKKDRRPGPMAELAAAAGDEEIESMLDVWKRKRTLKGER
jgi:hypothetical protein